MNRPTITPASATAVPTAKTHANEARDGGFTVATGVFGAHMDVEIHNDGPVTLWLER